MSGIVGFGNSIQQLHSFFLQFISESWNTITNHENIAASFLYSSGLPPWGPGAKPITSFAAEVVEEIKAAHPDITGLSWPIDRKGLSNHRATEAKEIGQKSTRMN